MPPTIPYPHSLQVRRSQRPQGTDASIPPLRIPALGPPPQGISEPLSTFAPPGSLAPRLAALAPPQAEILRPDFGRTRAKDIAALRALAARVLPRLERRQGFAPVTIVRAANDTRLSEVPASLGPSRAPKAWSLVARRVLGASSEPPPSSDDPRGCA
jgi:hypothetical protein